MRLTGGAWELVIVLDVGPRIMHFGFKGGANVFGELDEQLGKSGEASWMLRGGHRLWVAPEHKPDKRARRLIRALGDIDAL